MKRRVIFLAVLCITLLGQNSDSRLAEGWPYDRLSRESKLIVIAVPYKQEKIDETAMLPNIYPEIEVKGILTTFVVLRVLKGNLDNKTFVLHHFYLENPPQVSLKNGPMLASFDLGKKHAYLMFLKKEPEGRFVAMSGQTDPANSIKGIGEGEYFYDE